MRKISDLKLYTNLTKRVRFKGKSQSDKFIILYFSENSDLKTDYSNLGFLKTDIRNVFVPRTRLPRVMLDAKTRSEYSSLGLKVFTTGQIVPKRQNVLVDLSKYIDAVDDKLKPKHYRARAGYFLLNQINELFLSYPDYKKVILYTVNLKKGNVNQFINRKVYPIIKQLKESNINFDYLLYGLIHENQSIYRLLVKERDYNFVRILSYIRNLKIPKISGDDSGDDSEDIDEITPKEIDDSVEKVTNKKVLDTIKIKDPEKIKKLTKDYLEKNKSETRKIIDTPGSFSIERAAQTIISSILYKVTGSIKRTNKLVNVIPKTRLLPAVQAVDKSYSDNIIIPKKPINKTKTQTLKLYNIPSSTDNKYPSHLFEKRRIDFETNLKSDIQNAFGVLSKKEIPLKVKTLEVIEKPSKKSELMQSDISTVQTELQDEFGNTHKINIDIPTIDPNSGTFKVNGTRKCLINQIILNPITFPTPHDSKFESSYSSFHIWSKRTKRFEYLEVYMGSYKIPLFILLSFAFGFDETMKRYEMKYEFSETKPKKDVKYSCKISDNKYIIFTNIDSKLKQEMADSLILSKIDEYKISTEFGSKDYFNSLIIKMTGKINSTFLISSNLDNIVDPVVRQVLINKQMPYDLEDIMQYMSEKVISGFVHDRNDLNWQRIRGSEVLVTLAQSQILGAYTEYKEQILSGNKNAEFKILQGKVLSDFINSQIVTDMEYANPIEEMSTITRVSPVGKNIGGIPDKRAVAGKALNVHSSYFGNIDPLDTPEGGNIGVVQQLTIDANITSARGLINTKKINENENSGMLSTTSSLTPFIEHNDGPRVILLTNQAKQGVPLRNPEPPIIRSGYESLLVDLLSDSFIKKSPCVGKIKDVSDSKIHIKCNNHKDVFVDTSPSHLRSGAGKDTLSVFIPKVKIGDVVNEGDIIAEGACVSNSSIAMGKTLMIAVMPYKGYNFEDGIVISDKVFNGMVSLHGIVEEMEISENDRILQIAKIGDMTKKGDILLRKTIGELEQLLGYDEEDETTVQMGQSLIKKSPGGKIVDIEIFCNLKKSDYPVLKDLIDKTDKKHKGESKEKYSVKGETIKGMLVKFKIEQELPTGNGDKLCNRHGNKGIISLVLPHNQMPKTPWGEHVDVVINPLGISNRMNVGQMLEFYSGLISKELGNRIISLKNKQKIIALLKEVLPLLDKTKDKSLSDVFIQRLSSSSNLLFEKFYNEINETGFFPLIFPPFKSPGYKNILTVMRKLNLKTGYKMFLPEFGTKTINDVPIGYMYFYKLEHLGDEKLHARSGGPRVSKTGQPTAGKRREGGQRVGEGETYSLLSYDCPTLLSELFGSLSDDIVSQNEMVAEILQTGKATFRKPKVSPTKDLLNAYFRGMGITRQ